ncbi:MAG: 50S ribosomal protein L11 methyltransferase [Clostridia bacterium]|nr:50S ribosomal protein L11 methyltransferase [Clostridia bacterium]
MDWLRVTVATTSAGIEPLSGRLYMLGITGIEIEDEGEFNEFLKENRRLWDYVDEALVERMRGETRVRVYLPDSAAGRELLVAVKEELRRLRECDAQGAYGRLALELDTLSEQDWAESWKKYFKPIRVGGKILICPQWEPLPADAGDRVVFTVEPGMVFGTGAHESTRLCLAAAERVIGAMTSPADPPALRVLDLGCGSGILSIVALLLGAREAVAVDIDPGAEKIALHNAELNGIGPGRYAVLTGDILADELLRREIGGGYDIVFANIVADVIIALAPSFPRFLKKGGVLIASGIIDERSEQTAAALEAAGLRVIRADTDRGWVGLTCGLDG